SKRVPTVLWTKASGISSANIAMAGKPVQCVGTMTAGENAASDRLVCRVRSVGGPGRWKPPITAKTGSGSRPGVTTRWYLPPWQIHVLDAVTCGDGPQLSHVRAAVRTSRRGQLCHVVLDATRCDDHDPTGWLDAEDRELVRRARRHMHNVTGTNNEG